jgi:hypothetical protein
MLVARGTGSWPRGKSRRGAMLLCLFPLSVHAGNLLPIGDWAGSPAGGALPASLSLDMGSTGGSANAKASISNVAPETSGRSLSIERLSAKGFSRLRFKTLIPVQAGHRYYFSCEVKCTFNGTGAYLVPLDAQGKDSAHFLLQDAVSTNPDVAINGNEIHLSRVLADHPDDFNTLDVTFTAPPGASLLSVTLDYGWNLGSAWFGDLQLLPLDDDTP